MISTRGRYAIRVMIDLAEQGHDGGYITLRDISERQEISKKYLEIIVRSLVTGGLIIGVSGKGGGYRLARKPEEYTIGEIVELMEGALSSVACLANRNYVCPRWDKCKTLPLWQEFDDLVRNFFYGKRLSDLLAAPDPAPDAGTSAASGDPAASDKTGQ